MINARIWKKLDSSVNGFVFQGFQRIRKGKSLSPSAHAGPDGIHLIPTYFSLKIDGQRPFSAPRLANRHRSNGQHQSQSGGS